MEMSDGCVRISRYINDRSNFLGYPLLSRVGNIVATYRVFSRDNEYFRDNGLYNKKA